MTARRATQRLLDVVGKRLSDIREAGTWKPERVITSTQGPSIFVSTRDCRVLNFCANNYLGLSDNLDVIQASKDEMDARGNGLSSVRFICGTQDSHKDLEGLVAKFHQADDSILYASCFDANAAIFETLLTPDDTVLSDELNHASIIDGIRLCKAKKQRYLHRDMTDLETKLRDSQDSRLRLIATDGVFSMDGVLAPLPEICDLAEEYDAVVFMDDCHGTGLIGPTGRGTDEFFGIQGRVDIINSTFGKALGGAIGGYTAAPQPVIDLLRQVARPYLFSNSLPPSVVGGTKRVFEMIMSDNSRLENLSARTAQFRTKMTDAGYTVGGHPEHPICPIMLGDARLAANFAEEMLKRNVFVIGFSYPVVPIGKARIRVQISAAHTEEDIDQAVQAFVEVGHELDVF